MEGFEIRRYDEVEDKVLKIFGSERVRYRSGNLRY